VYVTCWTQQSLRFPRESSKAHEDSRRQHWLFLHSVRYGAACSLELTGRYACIAAAPHHANSGGRDASWIWPGWWTGDTIVALVWTVSPVSSPVFLQGQQTKPHERVHARDRVPGKERFGKSKSIFSHKVSCILTGRAGSSLTSRVFDGCRGRSVNGRRSGDVDRCRSGEVDRSRGRVDRSRGGNFCGGHQIKWAAGSDQRRYWRLSSKPRARRRRVSRFVSHRGLDASGCSAKIVPNNKKMEPRRGTRTMNRKLGPERQPPLTLFVTHCMRPSVCSGRLLSFGEKKIK